MANLKYLRYIIIHKWWVFVSGLKWKVPIYLLIFHDFSKFLPSEWIPYTNYFYRGAPSSKTTKGKIVKPSTPEFEQAWNHHQNFNKHHWQYWVLIPDVDGGGPLEMPDKYVREMLADWEGAGRAITGIKNDHHALGWYTAHKDHMQFHENTRRKVEEYLNYG